MSDTQEKRWLPYRMDDQRIAFYRKAKADLKEKEQWFLDQCEKAGVEIDPYLSAQSAEVTDLMNQYFDNSQWFTVEGKQIHEA